MLERGRPTLCAALLSCAVHVSALGLAATVLVSSPLRYSQLAKITVLQRAIPLPIQESQGPAKGTAPPPPSAPPANVLQPRRPALPEPIVKRKLTPQVKPTPSAPVVK